MQGNSKIPIKHPKIKAAPIEPFSIKTAVRWRIKEGTFSFTGNLGQKTFIKLTEPASIKKTEAILEVIPEGRFKYPMTLKRPSPMRK